MRNDGFGLRAASLHARRLFWGALWVVFGVTANAADVPTAEDLAMLPLQALAKIKITAASFFQNNELDTAASVTLIQEQDWLRIGARRVTDAFQQVASLYTIPVVFAANGVSIRGLPLNGGKGVLNTLDDVPIPEFTNGNTFQRLAGLNLGTLDLMQIVRGPGSALYGSDAFHGVVSMRSFESLRDAASVDAFAASDGYYQSTVRFSNELGTAGRLSVAAAINGQPEQNIGYSFPNSANGAPLYGERDNEFSSQSVSLKFKSDTGASWNYDANAYAHRYEAEGFPGFGTVASGERDVSDASAEFYLARAAVVKQTTAHGSLSISGYYWTLDTDGMRFGKASNVFTRVLSTLEQYRSGLKAVYRDQWGEHTQLALALSADHHAVDSAKLVTLTDNGTLIRSVDQLYASAKRDTRSAMFEGNTEFGGQHFDLTYGARFDSYSDAPDHLSPRLGLIFHPQADSAIKLLYGHAFRIPVAVEIYGAIGSVQGDAALKPETFDSVELAWLKQTENWRVQVGVFHSVWQDGIANIPNPTPPPGLRATNLGRTDADGVEVEYQLKYGAWLTRFDAAYIKTDSDVTGSFTTIPALIATLGVGYELTALRSEVFVSQRVQSAVDDAVAGSPFAPTQLPVYWRVDVNAATRLTSHLKLWLTVRNLFDRHNVVPSSPAAQFGVPDDAFSVGLGIGYDF